MWLDSFVRRATAVPAVWNESETRKKRAKLIAEARAFTIQSTADEETDFKKALQKSEIYYKLRPHLPDDFRKLAERDDYLIGSIGHSHLPALAVMFLREVERLEKEWGVGS